MNSKMHSAGREPSSSTRSLRRPCSLVDDDDLAGLDLAHEIGADDVEPGGLAADHRVPFVAAQAERTHAVGIAEADQRVAAHDRRREGAADLGDGGAHGAQQVALRLVGDERRDHLGVGGAGELDALRR